jgi:hypothetical protein
MANPQSLSNNTKGVSKVKVKKAECTAIYFHPVFSPVIPDLPYVVSNDERNPVRSAYLQVCLTINKREANASLS